MIEMMTDRSIFRHSDSAGKPHYRAQLIADTAYETGEQWQRCKAKIAYVRLYDNDVLIFNGIPKINPATGKACLYDSVNDKYYGNADTGSQTDFEIIEE